MNKRNTFLLILLVAQAALFGALSLPGRDTAPQRVSLLAGITPNTVVALEVADAEGKTIRLEKREAFWVLASQENLPVEPKRIEETLDKLVGLASNQLVTRTNESHGRFLVAEKRFRQRLTLSMADGSKKILFLGSSPTYKTTHVRADGDQRIYLVRDFSSLDVPLNPQAWWKSGYVDQPEEQLTRIHITNSHGGITLTRQAGGKWEMTEPRNGGTPDPARVQALVDRVRRVMLTEYLGQEEKEEYGLKTPSATLTLSGTGGETVLRVGTTEQATNSLVIKSSTSPYYARTAKVMLAGILDATAEALVMGAPMEDSKPLPATEHPQNL